jgi:hypothetical protein
MNRRFSHEDRERSARRRDLLCRPRKHLVPPAWGSAATLAGGALRRNGEERLARHGLFSIAKRTGRRNR